MFVLPKGLTAEVIVPEYDGILGIATGRKRYERVWDNTEISWKEFLSKLSVTTRTRESVEEYHAMSKSVQADVKDVGGFVGGTLREGRRNAGSVSSRSLLTLDVDYPPKDFWETHISLIRGNLAACVYSTHSHRAGHERLRLILPLSRRVSPDEYAAVSRKFAQGIGIDFFDDTTYQPERLMYWPSTPADGEYYFEWQDGEWLDVDSILEQYDDWRDATQWPTSSRTQTLRERENRKLGDPEDKPGYVGAFCRTYSISEAIAAFLPEVYIEHSPGRFTYTKGSTAGGLVVYEDKYAFSHHGTDPISGRSVNAFDLVRLHLYGELDLEAKPDTPINRLPSHKEMLKLAEGQQNVYAELVSVKFEPIVQEELQFNAMGTKLLSTAQNVKILASRLIGDKVKRNTFSNRMEVHGDLPWHKNEGVRTWTDWDDAMMRLVLESDYEITGSGKVADGITAMFLERDYHPVKDYLQGLMWDGVERVDTVLEDYLGVQEPSAYTRAATRKTLVGAVKRIMEPGCKFDYTLTLVGGQGIGKSSILRQLAGDWLQETLLDMEGKDGAESLQGYWIVEVSELNAVRKSSREAIKSFISRQVDSFRVAYGHHVTDYPRQCIFIGTTNDDTFLNDPTGGRRFWPVHCSGEPRIEGGWTALDEAARDQIWAEAYQLYIGGEKLYMDSEELAEGAQEAQEGAYKEDERRGIVMEFLDRKIPVNWEEYSMQDRRNFFAFSPPEQVELVPREAVCNAEIFWECFGTRPEDIARRDSYAMFEILGSIPGWIKAKSKKRFGVYGQQVYFKRTIK